MGIKWRRVQKRQRDSRQIFSEWCGSVSARGAPANEMTVLMKLDDRLPVQRVRGVRRINIRVRMRLSPVLTKGIGSKPSERDCERAGGQSGGRSVAGEYYNSFVAKYRAQRSPLFNESRDV